MQYVSKASGSDGAQEFLENVQSNTKQYLKLFAEAADDCLPESSVPVEDDVYDVLQAQVGFRRRAIYNAVVFMSMNHPCCTK